MGSETRLATVLFGSVVLWLPALGAVVRGDLDAGAAGIRYAIGAVLVWAAVAAINQLVQGYAVAARTTAGGLRPDATTGPEVGDWEPPGRRSEDRDESGPVPVDGGEPSAGPVG